MKKKTLKEKIDRVCWWAVALTVLYFIVGAFLKSDGPKFDPAKTYDLIKDTLTLTATFLAPVAAFVLFSDWRDEHKVKSLFELLDSIKKLAKDVEASLIVYINSIESLNFELKADASVLRLNEKIIQDLMQLNLLYRELEARSEDLSKYMKIVEDFYKEAMYLNRLLYIIESKAILIKEIENFNKGKASEERIDPKLEKDTYDKRYQDYLRSYPNVETALNNLIIEESRIKEHY